MDGSVGAYFRIHRNNLNLNPPYHRADAVALQHPKAQKKSGILVDLGPQYWPGQFLTTNRVICK